MRPEGQIIQVSPSFAMELVEDCARAEAEVITLRAQVERLSAPVEEKELNYKIAQVMVAVKGTQNIWETWSLYRAIVTLFIAARKEALNGNMV
jgi:hypothetical protein